MNNYTIAYRTSPETFEETGRADVAAIMRSRGIAFLVVLEHPQRLRKRLGMEMQDGRIVLMEGIPDDIRSAR
jgi:hypothetical protein